MTVGNEAWATQEFFGDCPKRKREDGDQDDACGGENKRPKYEDRQPPESNQTKTLPQAAMRAVEAYVKGPMLGEGGMGSVFSGTRLSDGKRVAIKYVPKDNEQDEYALVDGRAPEPLEVFLMKQVTSDPDCPNVLKIINWYNAPQKFLMILEHPEHSQDLHKFCKQNGKLDENQAKQVLVQLIHAVQHCESRGVFHRDIKPENLLVCGGLENIKLLDFGCGHILQDTTYTSYAGTTLYAPPEWFRHKSYHARPATIWSIGVTLYEVLAGKMPYRDPRKLHTLRFPRQLSEGCRDLIRQCLRAKADDRPKLEDLLLHPWLQESHQ